MQNKFKLFGIIALLAIIGFSVIACNSDGDEGGGGGGYYNPSSTTYYTVEYSVGEGSGSAPSGGTYESGTRITLPGQSNMIAPSGKEFAGWTRDGYKYDEGESYSVYSNSYFIARWTTVSTPTTPAAPTTPSLPGYIFLKNDSALDNLDMIWVIDAATNSIIEQDSTRLSMGELRRFDNIPGGKSYIVRVRIEGDNLTFSSSSFLLPSEGIIYLKYWAHSVSLSD